MIELVRQGFGNATIVGAQISDGMVKLTVVSDDQKLTFSDRIDPEMAQLTRMTVGHTNHFNRPRQYSTEKIKGVRALIMKLPYLKENRQPEKISTIPNCVWSITNYPDESYSIVIVLPKQKKATNRKNSKKEKQAV